MALKQARGSRALGDVSSFLLLRRDNTCSRRVINACVRCVTVVCGGRASALPNICLLYTSDAADE